MTSQPWRHRKAAAYYTGLVALRLVTNTVTMTLACVARATDQLDDIVIANLNYQAQRLKGERKLVAFGVSVQNDIDQINEESS